MVWLKTVKKETLKKEIAEANNAYYNSDTPIMSDQEYDIKLEQLQDLDENLGQEVGAPVLDKLEKIEITPTPMLSLDKCHTTEEIKQFFKKGKTVIASLKCDGVSVRLKYKDGQLVSANTRGDGIIGANITEHAKHFKRTPLVIDAPGEYIIDGEAIIKYSDFEEINQDGKFKNPRNTVAGTLNSLDPYETYRRKISFIAWEVISEENPSNSRAERLEKASRLGFTVVSFATLIDFNLEEIDETNKTMSLWNRNGDIPNDGVVWKYDDIEYGKSLGVTSHHPKDGIAWKPEVETVESRLEYIDWTMGRTGVLTPVAVFQPVELDGREISRASLHNLSVLKEKLGNHPYCGQKIWVGLANMIIPQIIYSEEE